MKTQIRSALLFVFFVCPSSAQNEWLKEKGWLGGAGARAPQSNNQTLILKDQQAKNPPLRDSSGSSSKKRLAPTGQHSPGSIKEHKPEKYSRADEEAPDITESELVNPEYSRADEEAAYLFERDFGAAESSRADEEAADNAIWKSPADKSSHAGEEALPSSSPFAPIQNLGWMKRDTAYYKIPVIKNLDLIYSGDFKSFASLLADYAKKINFKLSKIFQSNPHFRQNIIYLPSSRRQISNAYATVAPFPFVAIYPSSSADFMDSLSLFYWAQDMLAHEMTHIYQLSQNLSLDRRLWRILGSLSYRNLLLGSWIVEGSAVLNESIYGSGGRLFSGWARAFTFAQIKKGLSLKRMLRPYDDPFSQTEKYLHGGYFFAYLHSQYGMESISRFFSESGKLAPLDFYGLNYPLKKVFGANLSALFENYKKHYAPLAEKQKSSPEQAILISKAHLPLNSDERKIYFLISDMKAPPQLILFDKKTKAIQKKRADLPLGKIFHRKGRHYSAAAGRTGSSSIEHSLFGEKFKPLQKYNSLHVMDFYKDQFIALDTKQSHIQNSLLLNKAFYGAAHSSAIMDHKGRIYYFKQNKNIRTLYRDKKPLIGFPSYYAYPVEADQEGVYFIGATPRGSSLFVYKEPGGVFRLSESDTISQARKIQGNEFLVSEIAPTRYEYKIIQTRLIPEQPALYTYSFKKESAFDGGPEKEQHGAEPASGLKEQALNLKAQNLPFAEAEKDALSGPQSPPSAKKRPAGAQDPLSPGFKTSKSLIPPSLPAEQFDSHQFYSPLKNLSLQEVSFLKFDGWRPVWKTSFKFLDPLQFNKLSFFYLSSKKQKSFELSYAYQKYRPILKTALIGDKTYITDRANFGAQAFKDIKILKTDNNFDLLSSLADQLQPAILINRAFDLSLAYPLAIRPRWDLSWTNSLRWGQIQLIDQDHFFPFLSYKPAGWRNYIRHEGGLKYSFSRKYPYAYSFYDKKDLELSYSIMSLETKPKSYNPILNGEIYVGWTQEFGKEWFVALNSAGKKRLWSRKPIQPSPAIKKDSSAAAGDLKRSIQDLFVLELKILKALNQSYYPLKIPLAIRRWAPLAGLAFSAFQPAYSASQLFIFPFIGAEWELMVLHENNICKLGFSIERPFNLSSLSQPAKPQLSFWLKGSL